MVVAIAVFYLSISSSTEPFITVDSNTVKAQHSLLQFEGERRYNDFARLQNPETNISSAKADALLTQSIPVASSRTDSLSTLIGFTKLGAADDGVGKAADVEQTGMVQAKINFCEGITTVNCDLLDDPRLAECGFCHKNGVNSKGKAHRGGMFISSDDQVRANEVSNAAFGVKALYKPTIGTCDPKHFTVMKDSCIATEKHIQCQTTGAATSQNECGQCYGSSASSQTGLLYYGPKGTNSNPDRTTVFLHVSHPGGHSLNGSGFVVTHANGTIERGPVSNEPLFDRRSIPINIQEGDSLKIEVYGVPKVWCAWLSNQSGTRTVGLDIGIQGVAPANGVTVAGDKHSLIVKKAFSAAGLNADALLKDFPNTALWYQRRNEVLPGMIIGASYGPMNVTDKIKKAATGDQDIQASNNYFQNDPQYGEIKWLTVKMDNGRNLFVREGETLPIRKIRNAVTIQFTMPASLEEPMYDTDRAACATGPIVTTEIGAGLMGSNSCFNAEGAFNPTLYCMQMLFQAAGGTPQGTMYPKTAVAATALAVKDSAGKPSLDLTSQLFNDKSNIALYGVDSNGIQKPFATVKAAALEMLGIIMNNPCDGPNAQTGPQTPECLDYLWRTSGDASRDSIQRETGTLPYAYCGSAGQSAPLLNQNNVDAVQYAPIQAIRTYYKSIYDRARDTTDFDKQAVAMRQCYNISMSVPRDDPATCPLPNPTDWQCFGPRKLLKPEVFQPNIGYSVAQQDAAATCAKYGARVATLAELATAQQQGADWCSAGWVSDATESKWPMNTILPEYKYGCGSVGVNTWTPQSRLASVNCFGRKPAQGAESVHPFKSNGSMWYNPNSLPGFSGSQTIVGQEVANTVYCGKGANNACMTFPNEGACTDWLANNKPADKIALLSVPGSLGATIDKYVRERV